MLPLVIIADKFSKLRRWEEPQSTTCFLLFFLHDDIQVSAILLQLIVQMYSSYYESV
jgi:hypothetical protein